VTAHPLLPGRLWQPGEELADTAERWDVARSEGRYDGGFVTVREDTVRTPAGDEFARLVVEHQGAVGVVALDADDRVLLLRQYRHAVGRRLLELPAGILDVDGESAQAAAARELVEETDVAAADWAQLVEVWSSPGMTDEHWQVFVATGLSPAAEGTVPERHHEEAHMEVVWVPLAEAVRAVLERRITDSMAMVGLLGEWARRRG
jgi:8-oxo-dGTP pyrophosphatase MutT (NUDIX family)